MAFDKTPTAWIPGYTSDGTDITAPIASFSELDASEADPATGDIRKINFATLEHMWQEWNSRDSADLPAKWKMTKSASVNTSTGITTYQYNVTVQVETSGQEVVDEVI